MFRYDSPVMEWLSRVADLMLLNVITLVTMLPVVTIGAALTAMHSVLLAMVRDRGGNVVPAYFKAFRSNFKQATLLWGIMAVLGVALFLDWRISRAGGGLLGTVMTVLVEGAGLVWYLTFLYLFPLQARFENRKRETLRNALIFTVAALPRTIGMLAASALPLLLVLLAGPRSVPFLFFFGAAGPGYLCAMLYSPFFKQFEPAEEAEDPDGE